VTRWATDEAKEHANPIPVLVSPCDYPYLGIVKGCAALEGWDRTVRDVELGIETPAGLQSTGLFYSPAFLMCLRISVLAQVVEPFSGLFGASSKVLPPALERTITVLILAEERRSREAPGLIV